MIKLIAIALIILGVCSVAWGGFTYKSKEKIVDIGPIEASREKTHYVPVRSCGRWVGIGCRNWPAGSAQRIGVESNMLHT